MGQLIDFGGKILKKNKPDLQDVDIIKLLPMLKNLKGETIVINIAKNVIDNDELLPKLLREIVTIKCMGATVLIVPDVNSQINDFCLEFFNIEDALHHSNYVDLLNQFDVIDVIFKRDTVDKISKILKSFNSMSLGLSGHQLDIIFPDNVINKEQNMFEMSTKSMYHGMSEKKNKKYSIDMLEEILKTDIVPIVAPTFAVIDGSIYAMESSLFGSYLSTYLSSLKYVEVFTDEQSIPTSCIYGIERFNDIVKKGNFSNKALQLIHSGIEAVKNGIQGTHIVDIKQVSLMEEFCGKTFAGLFLYDDTLNQL